MSENKYFLMHQPPCVCYIIEDSEVCAWHNGKPSIITADCVYAAETLPDMLHQIQDARDSRFYIAQDWIDSGRITRHKAYPHHIGINPITGVIREVCDIRTDDHPYLAEWEVEYISELWYRDGDRLTKVKYFTEKMEAAVKDYIKEDGLVFDEGGK